MTPEVRHFVERNKDKLSGTVLEVGGMDVNGCLRDLLPGAHVTDFLPGKNVDEVCAAENLLERFGHESFDGVVTTDALEHMEHWQDALTNMWGVLKKDGWLVITMACPTKQYHGYPGDYVRLSTEDIRSVWADVTVEKLGNASIGWVAQKTFDVLDLSKTVPTIPVKPR